ncbi:MAG TPA: thiolase family protein [Solirubrobacteraceae bacterium]
MSGIAIAGVGLHAFGRHEGVSGMAMGVHAVRAALADAGLSWDQIEFAYGGSEDAGNADTMVADLGLTGLPFINVKNGCATGGSALVSAWRAIESGAFEIGIALGFDKHPRGAFVNDPADWGLPAWYGEAGLMVTTQFFGMKIQRYMHDHAIPERTLAQVAAKAFRNGADNPNAWRRQPLSVEDVAGAQMLSHPLTQYMFCSPGEGAAAVVLCHPRVLERLDGVRPVYLRGASLRSRGRGSFEVFSPSLGLDVAPSPTVAAARDAFEQAGIGPDEVDVVQVQDTESGAEIIHLAECGLCDDGEQVELYDTGATEIGGRLPVNTDGGCIANGEPVGASGLRQVCEVVTQLRGEAGTRQVPGDPRVGFTHVYGAPGVSACTVLSV